MEPGGLEPPTSRVRFRLAGPWALRFWPSTVQIAARCGRTRNPDATSVGVGCRSLLRPPLPHAMRTHSRYTTPSPRESPPAFADGTARLHPRTRVALFALRPYQPSARSVFQPAAVLARVRFLPPPLCKLPDSPDFLVRLRGFHRRFLKGLSDRIARAGTLKGATASGSSISRSSVALAQFRGKAAVQQHVAGMEHSRAVLEAAV